MNRENENGCCGWSWRGFLAPSSIRFLIFFFSSGGRMYIETLHTLYNNIEYIYTLFCLFVVVVVCILSLWRVISVPFLFTTLTAPFLILLSDPQNGRVTFFSSLCENYWKTKTQRNRSPTPLLSVIKSEKIVHLFQFKSEKKQVKRCTYSVTPRLQEKTHPHFGLIRFDAAAAAAAWLLRNLCHYTTSTPLSFSRKMSGYIILVFIASLSSSSFKKKGALKVETRSGEVVTW